MHAHLLVGSALLAQSLAAIVEASPSVSTSPALITPGPQIELLRKQNNDQFMGWLQPALGGSWISQTCNAGNTYYATGNYWGCCTTTRDGCAVMPIGCVSGSMIYRLTASPGSTLTNSMLTYPCTSLWTESSQQSWTICNTGSMFINSLDNSPKTQIFCGDAKSNWSYFKAAPATSATASSTPSRSATPSSGSATTTPSRSSSATSSPTSGPAVVTPDPVPAKKSKAWIAGAVIGPLLGLALIGLGIFFCLRRKKNKNKTAPATGSVGPAPDAYQKNTYGAGPNSPPQYYAPMEQNAGAPGFVPVGVAKQDNYQPLSPMQHGSPQPNMQAPYGAPPQQWQQPAYGQSSPSGTPQPPHAQPAPYMAERHFSSELEGSHAPGQPEVVNVQPKPHELR